MSAEVWKDRDVAAAFLNERSLLIPDRSRQLNVMLRALRFAPRALHRVLDLGCGDAILLATILETFADAKGVGVDFSPLMLEQARARLARYGERGATVEADLGTSSWIGSVTGPFDAVISGFAIHHLPDVRKLALYREIYGLLCKGGVFLNAEHVSSPAPRVEQMFNDAMAGTPLRAPTRARRGRDIRAGKTRIAGAARPGGEYLSSGRSAVCLASRTWFSRRGLLLEIL